MAASVAGPGAAKRERLVMRRKRSVTYLWPGLPQLWSRGSWGGLAGAAATAALLNLGLLGTFGWSELIAPPMRTAIWLTLGVIWLGSAILSAIGDHRRRQVEDLDPADGAFAEALQHYLKADWFQAEGSLRGLLRRNGADLDARLMLATLLRHTGRLEEATGQLDLLGRFEGAAKWEWEISRERELLIGARKPAEDQQEEKAQGQSGRSAA